MTDDVGALSAANPRIKRLRRLSGRRSSRLDDGAFVIEGAVLVREAIAAGLDIEAIYVDASEGALIAEFEGRVRAVSAVAPGVLASILPAVSGQPVGAIAAASLVRPLDDLLASAVADGRPVLVAVDVSDPGNVGTLMRAAESAGCGGVVLAGSGVDLYNPKVVRASAGSMFRLGVALAPDVAAMQTTIADHGVVMVAAVAAGGTPHIDAPLDGSVAILLGNEAHGLAGDVVDRANLRVTITMDGPAESLNVAMAGTVLCFEALRQRLAARSISARPGGERPG